MKKDREIRVRISKRDEQRIEKLTEHLEMTVSELIRWLIWKEEGEINGKAKQQTADQ